MSRPLGSSPDKRSRDAYEVDYPLQDAVVQPGLLKRRRKVVVKLPSPFKQNIMDQAVQVAMGHTEDETKQSPAAKAGSTTISSKMKGGNRYLLPTREVVNMSVSGLPFPSVASFMAFFVGSSPLMQQLLLASPKSVVLKGYHQRLHMVVRQAYAGGKAARVTDIQQGLKDLERDHADRFKSTFEKHRVQPDSKDMERLFRALKIVVLQRLRKDEMFMRLMHWHSRHNTVFTVRDNGRMPLMGWLAFLDKASVFGTSTKGQGHNLYGALLQSMATNMALTLDREAAKRTLPTDTDFTPMSPEDVYHAVFAPLDGIVHFYSALNNKWAVFSNFRKVEKPLKAFGREWKTVEHGFQALKFMDDPDNRQRMDRAALIAAAPTANGAAKLGRERIEELPLRTDWEERKVGFMEVLLRAKWDASETFRTTLLSTGTDILVERSPYDLFWGDGAVGRSVGPGKNMLGKLLMKIRDMEALHGLMDEAYHFKAEHELSVEL